MDNATLVNTLGLLPFGAFLVLLILQAIYPRRDVAASGIRRAVHNLLLFAFNTVMLRMLVPLSLVVVSAWAIDSQVGLSHMLPLPGVATVALSVVMLDLAVYWQHVATHKIGLLWRIHKVHHADRDMDVTTAIRFHPVELLLSLLYKSLIVVLLGAPVAAVILFELLLFIGPAFNHSNFALPKGFDKALRWVIATPDVHRVHHSTLVHEQNTNYGFFLIWWDKLFHTYTPQPSGGHMDMQIGLAAENEACDTLDRMLLAPFR
ncbi:MAG: sterol desaturase family protein [Arenicella sp.]|nr:sterol desaturase family protein [Arenicella sp.]